MLFLLLLACAAADSGERLTTVWLDSDGDGYGDPAMRVDATDVPVGYVANDDDCDDADAAVFPGAPESCNTRDDDCDGLVDEEPVEPETWYLDADGDGAGVRSDSVEACPAPDGYVATPGDCDDDDPSRSPTLAEVCENGIDDDCSGADARCGSLGTHSLSEADVKILGDQPERELGGAVSMGPDCVGNGTGSLMVYQPETNGYSSEGGFPAAWTAFSGTGLKAQTLPGDGKVIGSQTDAGLSVYANAGCFPAVAPGGGRALLAATWPSNSDDLYAAVGFPAPVASAQTLESPPLGIGYGLGGRIDSLGAGDLDGDGLVELVAATDSGASGTGLIWIFGESWDPIDYIAMLTPHALHDGAAMGHSLCVSDLDGDGLDDIATGAQIIPGNYVPTYAAAGAVWIKYGPMSGLTYLDDGDGGLDEGDGLWTGSGGYEYAGQSLTCKRDVTGDGLPDLLAGAHGAEDDETSTPGSAYLVAGPAGGVHEFSEAAWIARAEAPEISFGWSVTSDSDLDGDGLGDVVVAGAHEYWSAGATYVFYASDLGGTASNLDAAATWVADADKDHAWQLAGGADLDGDGFDDLAIGADGDDTNGEDAGAVYVIFGGSH